MLTIHKPSVTWLLQRLGAGGQYACVEGDVIHAIQNAESGGYA